MDPSFESGSELTTLKFTEHSGSTTSKPQKNVSLSDTAATAIVGILKGNPTSECPGDTESSRKHSKHLEF